MQLTLDRTILEKLFEVAASAARRTADDLFDDAMWVKDGAQTRRIERLSHLVGAAAEAVLAAMEAADKLANDLSTRPAGA